MTYLAVLLTISCGLWASAESRTYGQWTSFGNWTNNVESNRNGQSRLRLLYAWKRPDFFYDETLKKDIELGTRTILPDNSIMLGVDAFVRKDGVRVLYVTTPSVMKGNPYSLSFLADVKGRNTSQLRPFPNARWHKNEPGSCEGITSAFRIKVDKLGRLWVLDTGRIDAFVEPKQVCNPQILAFDLNNEGKLLHRYVIPSDQFTEKSLFVTIEVEVLENGSTWVYITDPVTYSMVVHSVAKKSSHVVKHPYFYPDPMYGNYHLNGVNFTLMDGLFSAIVVPGRAKSGKDNMLYFHSLSAGREFRVRTCLLKDKDAANKNFWDFKDLGYQRNFHVSAMAVNKNGIMVFPNLEDNSILAWNTNMPYKPENFRVIARDTENLQFPSGLKIVGNDLYILTSRVQNVMVGNIPKDETNYRVLLGDLDKLLTNARPFTEKKPTKGPALANRFGGEDEDVTTTTEQQTEEGTTTDLTVDPEAVPETPENTLWEKVPTDTAAR